MALNGLNWAGGILPTWLFADGGEPDIDTLAGLRGVPYPDNFEKWKAAEKARCQETMDLSDNRFRLYVHCLDPVWARSNDDTLIRERIGELSTDRPFQIRKIENIEKK